MSLRLGARLRPALRRESEHGSGSLKFLRARLPGTEGLVLSGSGQSDRSTEMALRDPSRLLAGTVETAVP